MCDSLIAARNRQATRTYERSGKLPDGFHPLLTKNEKNCRCAQLLIGYFSHNFVFYPDLTMQAPYQ
ncbi:hypothetical protein C7B69_20330 [filamentous cyanobacterium Phorm 46]|nr:hypothetical protein C7B69_20330 [filamentous cyanobacterium Phorm 46]